MKKTIVATILGYLILILIVLMITLNFVSCQGQEVIKATVKIGSYSDYQIKVAANSLKLNKVDIYRLLDRPVNNSLKTYSKYFKCSRKDLRIATTAMACLESGNLKSESMYVNNLFGIKRSVDRPKFVIVTSEYIGKREYRLEQKFTVFFSIEDCVNGYYKFLLDDRYKMVREAKNYKQFLYAIQACGYATDPRYFEKAYRIARVIDGNI